MEDRQVRGQLLNELVKLADKRQDLEAQLGTILKEGAEGGGRGGGGQAADAGGW
jgi:hypothetical protein